MWSHYADGLRGYCIEFDDNLLMSNISDSAAIYDVLYDRQPSTNDTAVVAVLNDQVDLHEEAIAEAEAQVKHLGKDMKSEIKMYEDYLGDVYKKNSEIYQKMLATKPTEWSYEEDVRIIMQSSLDSKAGITFEYPPESVKSIIVGEKMPKRQIQSLKKVLSRHLPDAEVKKASRRPGSFSVVIAKET